MSRFFSPLRYPGGKGGLTNFLGSLIDHNELGDCVYAEPYAGGAGAALNLLYGEYVSRIAINDYDLSIYSFWQSILTRPNQFLKMMEDAELNVEEWRKQKALYQKPSRQSRIRLGFAAFYLNRCNRSGIICNAGPIGGFNQTGDWKIDARFNKETIRERIEKIHLFRDRIQAFNLDAITFLRTKLKNWSKKESVFVYLDPPYYDKGNELYLNAYNHDDHEKLADFLSKPLPFKWVMTYDNTREIRKLYSAFPKRSFSLSYSAHSRREGKEILIHDPSLELPKNFRKLLK